MKKVIKVVFANDFLKKKRKVLLGKEILILSGKKNLIALASIKQNKLFYLIS
jgi:hypothetical protein